MNKMDISHGETLNTLLKHLLKVITKSEQNHMSIRSMSIVWGPSIIFQTTEPLNGSIQQKALILMEQSELSNKIVEMLLNSYNEHEFIEPPINVSS